MAWLSRGDEAEAKASLNRAKYVSLGIDAKRSELSLARVKYG